VVVAGGSDLGGGAIPDVEVLDLSQPGEIEDFRWEVLPGMSPRKDCLGVAYAGCLWVVSGRRGVGDSFLNLYQSAAVLDLEERTWRTVGRDWDCKTPKEKRSARRIVTY
jgi:hypothetical protein